MRLLIEINESSFSKVEDKSLMKETLKENGRLGDNDKEKTSIT